MKNRFVITAKNHYFDNGEWISIGCYAQSCWCFPYDQDRERAKKTAEDFLTTIHPGRVPVMNEVLYSGAPLIVEAPK